jgi:hypothetical protein
MNFARVKQAWEQQVLFPERPDEAVDADHDVRLVDKILRSVGFSNGSTSANENSNIISL